jgi:uncharacterized protein (TIGR03437 family)
VTLSASHDGVVKSYELTIDNPQADEAKPTGLACDPTPATAGSHLLCTVTFDTAPAVPARILLTSSSPDLILPATAVWTSMSASLRFIALSRADAPTQTVRLTATIGTASTSTDVVLNQAIEPQNQAALARTAEISALTPPLLDRVVNEADPSLEAACSPGALMSVLGSRLTSANPTGEDASRVRVNGEEIVTLLRSPRRITFICPLAWPSEDLTLTVENEAGSSSPQRIPMREATPGVFRLEDLHPDQGMIVARETDRLASGPSPLAKAAMVRPGDVISVFLTGLGATSPLTADRALHDDASLRSRILLLIDGRPAEVIYAGMLDGLPGIHQVDARIPQAVTPGERVPVQIRLALTDGTEAASNITTIGITDR